MKKDADVFNLKLLKTDDGSFTLFNEELGETYHSRYGALAESRHVYIKNGLEYFHGINRIAVLEVGLGTGLNAWLSAIHAQKNCIQMRYDALEPFPLHPDLCIKPDFGEARFTQYWQAIQTSEWEKDVVVNPYFTFHKSVKKVQEIYVLDQCFHLVFFDAFAPNVQPELWSLEVFRSIFEHMHPGAVLVTYSSKGVVRRNLLSAGFSVEKLAGPPGKRQMLRALKP